MPKLPIISAKELIKILVSLGFEIKSQRGSHIKLVKYTSSGKRESLQFQIIRLSVREH